MLIISLHRNKHRVGWEWITENGHFDRAETTKFFNFKIVFAMKNFLLRYCIETILQQQLH